MTAGRTARANLFGAASLTSPHIQVPPDGEWVNAYYGSLAEYYDQQEAAGVYVDPAIRPGMPVRPTED